MRMSMVRNRPESCRREIPEPKRCYDDKDGDDDVDEEDDDLDDYDEDDFDDYIQVQGRFTTPAQSS